MLFFLLRFTDQDKDKFSAEELEAADNMVGYWTNFAKHGSPSPVSLHEDDIRPTWFPYTKESKVVFTFRVFLHLTIIMLSLTELS